MRILLRTPRIKWLGTAVLATVLAGLGGCRKHPAVTTDAVAVAAPASEGAIRIVCWNIEWFPGQSLSADPERQERHVEGIRGAFAELQPDIVFAQEVRSDDPLMEALSTVPGHKLGVISRFPGAQQTVTTGRIPIEAGWFERWERDGKDDPPRGFSHVSFRLPDGRLLLTYNLHLKSNAGGEPASNRTKREEAMRQLLAHIDSELPKYREDEKKPPAIIIAGDFNTDPDSTQFAGERTIPMLVEAGFVSAHADLPKPQRITWPSNGRYPDATFDFVFFKGLTVEQVKVPPSFDAFSDHRPVVVDFR